MSSRIFPCLVKISCYPKPRSKYLESRRNLGCSCGGRKGSVRVPVKNCLRCVSLKLISPLFLELYEDGMACT